MDPLAMAKRDAVERLCRAQADGLLTVDAFELRYQSVNHAETPAMVLAAIADLATGEAEAPQALDAFPLQPAGHTGQTLALSQAPLRLPAILGSSARAGRWTVPPQVDVLVVFGEMVLDFRDAIWPGDSVVVNASVTAGSLKIVVPPGTQVENECREVLSTSKRARSREHARPNGLLVVVEGTLRFAELEIRERPVSGDRPAPDTA